MWLFSSLWEEFFPAYWSLAAAKKCDPKVTFRWELSKTWWLGILSWKGRARGGCTGGPDWKWIWLSSRLCQEARSCGIKFPGLGAWEDWVSSGSGHWVSLGVTLRIGMKRGSWAGAAVWLYTEHSPGSHLIGLLQFRFLFKGRFLFLFYCLWGDFPNEPSLSFLKRLFLRAVGEFPSSDQTVARQDGITDLHLGIFSQAFCYFLFPKSLCSLETEELSRGQIGFRKKERKGAFSPPPVPCYSDIGWKIRPQERTDGFRLTTLHVPQELGLDGMITNLQSDWCVRISLLYLKWIETLSLKKAVKNHYFF